MSSRDVVASKEAHGSRGWPHRFSTRQRPADTLKWRWSYRSGVGGSAVRGRGELITNAVADADGFYRILAISGRRNRDCITGLFPAGTSIPGNEPYAGDNLVRSVTRAGGQGQLTKNGLQFALSDGSYSNIFYADFLAPPAPMEFHSESPFPTGAVAPNSEIVVSFKAWIVA